jgi:hypothetical protein
VISNPRGLLARQEVQQEIGLDLKQRNALTAMQEEGANAIKERVRLAMQGQDPQVNAMSPEQRRVWLTRQQQQLARAEATAQQPQGELDAKILQILRPEQVERLHELDLQKRGPLALGDPRVQQDLKLSSQTRAAESRISGEYRNRLRTIVAEAMREATQSGDLRQGNLPDFTGRLSPLRKKLEANREQAEKQALDALTDEEKASWTAAQGKPFRFRPDSPQTSSRQQSLNGRR